MICNLSYRLRVRAVAMTALISIFAGIPLASAQAEGRCQDRLLAVDSWTSQQREDICRRVNEIRRRHALPLLTLGVRHSQVAQLHAHDMVEEAFFSHVSSDGRQLKDRLKEGRVRYGWAGENIASGYRNAEDVVAGWMRSPGHRANILNKNYRQLGVGQLQGRWVQVFTD